MFILTLSFPAAFDLNIITPLCAEPAGRPWIDAVLERLVTVQAEYSKVSEDDCLPTAWDGCGIPA